MEFTMLSTDLRREPRWRLLADHPTARLIYLSLMTSSMVSYTGFFHLPLPIFSYEAMMPDDKLRIGLTVLCKTGLVEFDEASEIIRIDEWFNERRTPQNRNQLKSSIKSYARPHLPRNEVMARSVADLSFAVIKKSREFGVNAKNPEASHRHRGQYIAELMMFLEQGLSDINGLEGALMEKFSGSDPKLRSYSQELIENLPQLNICGSHVFGGPAQEALQPSSLITLTERSANPCETLSEGLPNPTETLAKPLGYGTEAVGVEGEQEYRIRDQETEPMGPADSTINSALAKEVRNG